MRVWRITAAAHAAFDGEGTRRFGSRWIPRGVPAVHTSATLALAALELFVHTDPDLLPADAVARYADIPESLAVTTISVGDLPKNWREFPPSETLQEIGRHWVNQAATVVLSVPSVIIPPEHHFVLNPLHPDFARVEPGPSQGFQFDARTWKRSRGLA